MSEKKSPCWIGICDNCKEDLFGMEYISHFDSKKELMERFEDECEYVSNSNKRHFCSETCLISYRKRKGV